MQIINFILSMFDLKQNPILDSISLQRQGGIF